MLEALLLSTISFFSFLFFFLFFTNDSVLFCDAEVGNKRAIVLVLNDYKSASGHVILSEHMSDVEVKIFQLLGVRRVENCNACLGLPMFI